MVGQALLPPPAPLWATAEAAGEENKPGAPRNAEEGLAQCKPQRISPSSSCRSLKVFS